MRIRLLTAATVLAAGVAGAAVPFADGARVTFVGDSITHHGQYETYLQMMHQFRAPDAGTKFINAGVSGNTAGRGVARWTRDICAMRPDDVFIMMGMNDVNRGQWSGVAPKDDGEKAARQKTFDDYHRNMTELVSRAVAKVGANRVWVMTPSPYDSYGAYGTENLLGCNEPEGLTTCAQIVREVAAKAGVHTVELHAPITKILKEHPELKLWGGDRVHPGCAGHLLMAAHILDALGAAGEVSHVEQDARGRENLSFCYAPCALPFPNVPEVAAIDRVYPFTEKFNRETLVVKNLPAGNYEIVVDGKVLAKFSAEALARGVNMAPLATPNAARAKEAYDLGMKLCKYVDAMRQIAVADELVVNTGADLNGDFKAACDKADAWLEKNKSASWVGGCVHAINIWKRDKPQERAKLSVQETMRDAFMAVRRPLAYELTVRRVIGQTLEEHIALKLNADYQVKYPARVADMPQKKGVMSPPGVLSENDFKTIASWGGTLLRYQMVDGPQRTKDETLEQYFARYNTWLDWRLDQIEKIILPLGEKYGIMIVVDQHSPNGGGGAKGIQKDDAQLAFFVSSWQKIARRLKGKRGIYGYDLVNEPDLQSSEGRVRHTYWDLQKQAAEAIRAIDSDVTIIVEANWAAGTSAFAYLPPLAMDNVIYQVHMYDPLHYTHSSLFGPIDPKQTYPSAEKGYDKNYLRNQLRHVRAFQQKHHARIYVGEFSVISWAPGAEKWIKDVTDIFNEYGWDWTYHAFREWEAWSVEHDYIRPGVREPSNFRPSADNPRKRALLSAF